ncbi:MAG: YihY/virulence factor BrkB family protein [Cyanobacteriota bacterium]|nr:YihY/virulence factor BrkB family protein [Cyanobacteriota bacterium]
MRRQLARLQHKWRAWTLSHAWINNRYTLSSLRYSLENAIWARLIGRTFLKWQQDDCLEMGAALAYYGVFSLFPTILVVLSVVGFFTGPNTVAFSTVLDIAHQALPPDAFAIVKSTLTQFHTASTGAGLIGFTILLFTASGFFGALSRAFDKIWQVHSHPYFNQGYFSQGFGAIAFTFLWRRFLAFLLVIGSAGLVFLSLLSTIAIDTLLPWIEILNSLGLLIRVDQVQLLPWLRLLSSYLMLTLVVMVLYKVLPRTRVAWRDIWIGALFTASLWLILQQLISNSVISLGSRFRSYGVFSGFMVLMLWIYLSSQIFFLGGEFTYVYAHLLGSRRGGKHLKSRGST